jgi:glycosyltransferase involved in cell wall biosynthesis
VAVVVPTYRRPDALSRCLAALDRLSRPPDEIVVVHRASGDDATQAVVTAWLQSTGTPRRCSVEVSTPGVIQAMDAGVRATTGAIVVMLDDDVCLRPEWLDRCLAHYRNPRVAGVGGLDILHYDTGTDYVPHAEVGELRWYGRMIGNHHRGFGRARQVRFLKGANMSMRRSYWRFDHRLRGQGAQVHWEAQVCLEAVQRDSVLIYIYDPACVADHFPAPRFDADWRGNPQRQAIMDTCHNETFVLLRYLKPCRRAPFLLYTFLVGHRQSWAVGRWLVARARHEHVSWHRQVAPSYYGKVAGVWTWLCVTLETLRVARQRDRRGREQA